MAKRSYKRLQGDPHLNPQWFAYALGAAGGSIVTLYVHPVRLDTALGFARKFIAELPVYINVIVDDKLQIDEWIVEGSNAVGADPP